MALWGLLGGDVGGLGFRVSGLGGPRDQKGVLHAYRIARRVLLGKLLPGNDRGVFFPKRDWCSGRFRP